MTLFLVAMLAREETPSFSAEVIFKFVYCDIMAILVDHLFDMTSAKDFDALFSF